MFTNSYTVCEHSVRTTACITRSPIRAAIKQDTPLGGGVMRSLSSLHEKTGRCTQIINYVALSNDKRKDNIKFLLAE